MNRSEYDEIQCPRCRRWVTSDYKGRKAHGVSCVRIPYPLPDGWGVKTRKDKS